jgi:hypothetical protein
MTSATFHHSTQAVSTHSRASTIGQAVCLALAVSAATIVVALATVLYLGATSAETLIALHGH